MTKILRFLFAAMLALVPAGVVHAAGSGADTEAGAGAPDAELPVVRVGVLKFGTVNWELDTVRHHGLDRKHGVRVELVELANSEATKVALQGGTVNVIVTDWPWVSRQRAEGAVYTFVPYSLMVGSVLVPSDSRVRRLEDLSGKRLGVAGGPLDKNWLLLRAAAQLDGTDLDQQTVRSFAAPPLLNEQIMLGRLDAVLTYWNYGAHLLAKGYRPVMSVADAVHRLGITSDVPLLGYVFQEDWAAAIPDVVLGFVEATREAKALLARSDAEWQRLAPLTRAGDEATVRALRDGYRAGIPVRWGDAERSDAARLFGILAEIGGTDLVGPALELQPGTFWDAVRF